MTHDVLVLGGGLAGNLLARQIRRTVPEASVAVIEPTPNAARKVGESTVEIASDYLIRRHDLSTYLYDRQLPKNGLRFFFDTPERDAELLEMSELGSDHIPLFPTFQLDRARFEDDLREMNRDLGVDMRVGTRVHDVALSEVGDHVVTTRTDGCEEALRARWVVDATGRAMTISRQRDLALEVDHPLTAVWGRFTGALDLDTIAAPAWRGRARHTARQLSTNHFCYAGYWIWFIPLGGGVTSVGIVGERDAFPRGARSREGFRQFLDGHRAVRELLADAELIDIEGFTRLAYGTKTFFGAHRWALIGDAAAFVDPFYSPGSDFIAVENDLLTDLIRRDLRGDESEDTDRLTKTYDDFMKLRFDATLLLYQGQYRALGSYEILHQKWNFDLSTYYNLWLDQFMRDQHVLPGNLRTQLRRKTWILEALREFRDIFSGLADQLSASGDYHRANLGRFNPGTDLDFFWRAVGSDRRRREVNAVTQEIFARVRRDSLALVGGRADTKAAASDPTEAQPAGLGQSPISAVDCDRVAEE